MTDAAGMTATLKAVATIPGVIGPVYPTLVIRCHEGELDIYVNSRRVLDSDVEDVTPVRLRYDADDPEAQSWGVSSDHSSAFAAYPAELLTGPLNEAKEFRVELQPFDAAPVVAVFRPRGIKAVLSRVRKTCPEAFKSNLDELRKQIADARRKDSVETLAASVDTTKNVVTGLTVDGVDFPFPGYLNNVSRQILLRFSPLQLGGNRHATLRFVIRQDGSVFGISFLSRSGSYAFDLESQAAVEAASSAFGPLPEKFAGIGIPVKFTF
jgi:hypothetical protein